MQRIYQTLALLLLVPFFCRTGIAMPPETEPPRPMIIAHRGASGYLPEHTLAGVAMAYAQGADLIEPDVIISKDGTPLVLHDIYLDTVTNVRDVFPDRGRSDGRFYAIDFTVDEIKRLKVSERIDARTGHLVYPQRFPAGKSDFRVPTLAEEIELIQGLNQSTGRNVGLVVEFKQPAWHRREGKDIAKIVLSVLSRHGYRSRTDNCYLECFDADELKRLRSELKTDLKLVQLFDGDAWKSQSGEAGDIDVAAMQAGLSDVATYADGIGPALRLLVRIDGQGRSSPNEVVAEAHARKLIVFPYTFRRDAVPDFCPSFEALVLLFARDMGVDGLFTDFPDQTREILQQNPALR
jgi:glycerophosphoryl diester phosphodiesterase